VLEVGDPEYYVAFSLPSVEAVRLANAPAACRLNVHPGEKPDAVIAAQLAQIGADQRQLPPEMQSMTAGTENTAEVNCGVARAPPSTAGGAVSAMAGAGAASGDLTALPAAPASSSVVENALGQASSPPKERDVATSARVSGFATNPRPAASSAVAVAEAPALAPVAAAATSAPPRSVGLMRRWTAWIAGLQTQFNRDLTAGLKGLNHGQAFWWLGSVSFLYGIVHAAGPGHGKVVISTYLLANEARVRRGVVIAFIAAFVQAVVAVGIIGLMAVILNMTSMAIDSTAKIFEAGSFALVAALGVYLLVRKGRDAWTVLKGGDPHGHHHHGNDHNHDVSPSPLLGGARGGVAPAARSHAALHDHDHGHEHGHGDHRHNHNGGRRHPAPSPSPLRGGGHVAGLPGAAAAILSVGIRPCSGALIVLVFALSQGIFWAGVASTFVMALGTAITVAVLAALAVGAKDIARRLARGDDRRAGQVMLGLELAAAILITALGVTLFFSSIYSSGLPGSSIG
jgi:nickel/cobalt exporter